MIILFKYCADMEDCESFRGFGFIYIYIYIDNGRTIFYHRSRSQDTIIGGDQHGVELNSVTCCVHQVCGPNILHHSFRPMHNYVEVVANVLFIVSVQFLLSNCPIKICLVTDCYQAPKGQKASGIDRSTFALFMQPDWYIY